MKTMDRLNKLTYVVEHNPNCPMPFLVRLVGKNAARIDGKPPEETTDVLGFGLTLIAAARSALINKRKCDRDTVSRSKKRLKCIYKNNIFRDRIQELIWDGAHCPRRVSPSDWRYMQIHAQVCKHCAKKFERLVKKAKRENPDRDGPTTLT